ncbi:hypothetical protein [Burkholderia sp. D-99]|uniref:hypothetical protein n=1 Tax=Burkholderia sp. D-99 TaxID=2717316 RepID=UPI00142270CE|nr:hypothetical protein [Burkholderia sp. D-99]NHV28774.1 hypothetical protein [Burkholderia sp. D-99]
MKYEQLKSLEEYLEKVEAALLQEERRISFKYPQQSISPWNAQQLDAENESTLDLVAGCANVYAIFTAPRDSNVFTLRYIGKTTRKLARQRVRNHLIKKNERTGAKLENIVTHVQSGGLVKISWVTIEPESLRNYIEEELISRHKEADWNRENK